jgi:hypothetical protein
MVDIFTASESATAAVQNEKARSDAGFLWPAIPGGHPSGRRCATLKMAPGHFLCVMEWS